MAAAKSPLTPVETLVILATDGDWGVRKAVAANPHTPPAVLEDFLDDPYWEVVDGVAGNLNLSDHTCSLLSVSSDDRVRRTLVQNPRLPHPLLEALLLDCDPRVQRQAREIALKAVSRSASAN
jgi:hypothetical protein